jgi:hypothetical protein
METLMRVVAAAVVTLGKFGVVLVLWTLLSGVLLLRRGDRTVEKLWPMVSREWVLFAVLYLGGVGGVAYEKYVQLGAHANGHASATGALRGTAANK